VKGKSKAHSLRQRFAALAASGNHKEVFEVRPGALERGNAFPYAALRRFRYLPESDKREWNRDISRLSWAFARERCF